MRRVAFLDRDGTINSDHAQGYVAKIEDWQLAPHAAEGLVLLQSAGFALAVITNQSGIARHLYTTADMRAVHDHMTEELATHNIVLDAIAFCPHDRDSTCDCHKPMPGMAKHVEEQIGPINYTLSWTIGDKIADLQFGHGLGTQTALIQSKYWESDKLPVTPDLVVTSLFDAAQHIVKA